MKNTIKLDHENRRIVMDKTFAKLSEDVRNEEYDMLQRVRKDYPLYEVTKRQIKKNSAKECYKGLTYDFMRDYIANHSGALSEEYKYFESMVEISKCHSTAFRYPVIKQWFLDTYEEVKKYGVRSVEITSKEAMKVAA